MQKEKGIDPIMEARPFGYAYCEILAGSAEAPADFRFIDTNKTFSDVTGLSSSPVSGKSFSEVRTRFRSPASDWMDLCLSSALKGRSIFFESCPPPKDRWYRIFIQMEREGFFSILLIDVTEQKQKSLELEEFFSVNLDLLCIADTEGNFIKVNKEWEETLGYPAGELENRKFLDFVHPEDMEATLRAISTLSGQSKVLNFTNRYKRRDGSYRYIEWRSFPKGALIFAAARDITARIEMEEDLRKERLRLESIIEGTNTGTWEWDIKSGNIIINNRWAEIIGYGRDELETITIDRWKKLIHTEDIKSFVDLLDRHFKGEHSYFEAETRIRHRDGHWVWALDRGRITGRGEQGSPLLMHGTHQDITERKREGESLQRNQFAMDRARDSILWVDEEANIIYANDSSCSSLGYTREEMLRKKVFDIDPDFDPKKWDAHKKDMKRLGSMSFESRHTSREGRTFPVEVSSNYYEFDGRFFACAFDRDITERKREQEALTESEQKLKALFSSMTEMVALYEPLWDEKGELEDLLIRECNDSFIKNLRISKEEVSGKRLTEILGEDLLPHLGHLKNVVLTGRPYHIEIYFSSLQKHLSVSVVSPVKNKLATTAMDISDLKEAQHIIEIKNQELEQLIYIASHDLRTPLVNVEGYNREIEFLVKELDSHLKDGAEADKGLKDLVAARLPDIYESLGHIRNSAKQMDLLLKGLLKLSRLGRAALIIETLDMDSLVSQAVLSMDYQIKQAGAAVKVGKLEPCIGDAAQVSQVFINLLGNALKYSFPGRKVRISIKNKLHNRRCVYCVEDNGIGIAGEQQERIFQIFQRLDPQNSEGDGLGLTIVRQILGRMDGQVWVESEPGRGSRFFISLPAPLSDKRSTEDE